MPDYAFCPNPSHSHPDCTRWAVPSVFKWSQVPQLTWTSQVGRGSWLEFKCRAAWGQLVQWVGVEWSLVHPSKFRLVWSWYQVEPQSFFFKLCKKNFSTDVVLVYIFIWPSTSVMPVTQDHFSSIKATQCEWRPVTGINICNMMMWMMIIMLMLWGWKIRYRRLSRRERCRVRWHKGAAPLLWVDIVLPAGMTTHCFHRIQYRIVLTPISWGACPNFAFKAGSLNHWLKKRLGDRSNGWIRRYVGLSTYNQRGQANFVNYFFEKIGLKDHLVS